VGASHPQAARLPRCLHAYTGALCSGNVRILKTKEHLCISHCHHGWYVPKFEWMQSVNRIFLDDPKFVIRSIPGKGMGVIAVHPIAKGEVVLSEAPLFTQELARNKLTIWHSLASKTADEKRQFLELTNCHRQNPKVHPFLGIFQTNALPCGNNGMGEIALVAGLFLQGSRFNSSCVPNVNNYWSEEKHVITFRATNAITEGEELCISYKLGFEPRDSRRAQLQKEFGFECHCAACSQLGDELLISNLRRVALRSLYDDISLCGSKPAEGIQNVRLAK
jgi:hypothetical protein